MKKFLTSLLLVVCVASFCIPASAEGQPVDESAFDETEFAESTHSPMRRDSLTTIYSYKFSGLYNNKVYYRSQNSFVSSYVPTKTLYYSTNLQTTGSKSTVKMGLGKFDGVNDIIVSHSLVTMNLRDGTYAHPTMKSNESYFPYIYNTTGGVVTGTASWYRVDRLG